MGSTVPKQPTCPGGQNLLSGQDQVLTLGIGQRIVNDGTKLISRSVFLEPHSWGILHSGGTHSGSRRKFLKSLKRMNYDQLKPLLISTLPTTLKIKLDDSPYMVCWVLIKWNGWMLNLFVFQSQKLSFECYRQLIDIGPLTSSVLVV